MITVRSVTQHYRGETHQRSSWRETWRCGVAAGVSHLHLYKYSTHVASVSLPSGRALNDAMNVNKLCWWLESARVRGSLPTAVLHAAYYNTLTLARLAATQPTSLTVLPLTITHHLTRARGAHNAAPRRCVLATTRRCQYIMYIWNINSMIWTTRITYVYDCKYKIITRVACDDSSPGRGVW